MSKGEVLTPMNDDQLGRLSLIEAIRANTDAVDRLARYGERQDKKLDDIGAQLGKIDTRLTVIERSTLREEVKKNGDEIASIDGRVRTLELEREQRRGAMSAVEAVRKYGPLIVVLLTAFFVLMLATGRMHI